MSVSDFFDYNRNRKGFISCGYVRFRIHGHPKATSAGCVYEHHLVAERALGKHLPPGSCVHHIDGNGSNNNPSNLVICQDNAYHKLIHKRERSLKACGDPNKLRCCHCKQWDERRNLYVSKDKGEKAHHLACHAEYVRMQNRAKKLARMEQSLV